MPDLSHCRQENTLLGPTMSDDFEAVCRFYKWRWMFECIARVLQRIILRIPEL